MSAAGNCCSGARLSDGRSLLLQLIPPPAQRPTLGVALARSDPDGQDARVYAGLFDSDERAVLRVAPGRHAYVQVARGSIEVNGQRLEEGDGARVRTGGELEFTQGRNAEILVFELRA